MMSDTNNLLAFVLLIVALTDTLMATFILPKTLRKNPNATPEKIAWVVRAVNIASLAVFAIAVGIYIVRPFNVAG